MNSLRNFQVIFFVHSVVDLAIYSSLFTRNFLNIFAPTKFHRHWFKAFYSTRGSFVLRVLRMRWKFHSTISFFLSFSIGILPTFYVTCCRGIGEKFNKQDGSLMREIQREELTNRFVPRVVGNRDGAKWVKLLEFQGRSSLCLDCAYVC